MKAILGINAFHADAAACLVVDGHIVAAAEEERFRRIKHWAGFPSEAIRWCLADAALTPGDLAHVAINSDPHANRLRKLAYLLAYRPDPRFLMQKLRNKQERAGVEDELRRLFPNSGSGAKVHFVEHHLAHLSSAFHCSPFDEAVAVSVDGFGDFASGAWGIGRGSDVSVDGRVFFPHSLGAFYTAVTQFLGFPNYGDEYKVMGLAPYGEPRYLDQMRQIVPLETDGSYRLYLQYFRHARERLPHQWSSGTPVVGAHWSPAMEQLLGPARRPDQPLEQRHKDIARSAQAMYEEAFFHLLNALHRRYQVDQLAIAGGCGMNSVANGKVTQKTPFRRIYVQSAAGDAGGAIGAALTVWHQQGGARCQPMNHAYLGPRADRGEIESLLAARSSDIEAAGCSARHVDDERVLFDETAAAIAEGLVIGWFQGRMEWGPRALGNRSILGDPRRADMKDILNLKIKRRESFRPFAPSVLREAVPEWFELDGDVPFMMQVYPIRPEKRARIPAVTHVDGTGRLQTVTHEDNPRYYAVINAFRARTGVPMVLNTSFNENEPVVCRPEEALDCFLRTKMDVLVLENVIIRRGQSMRQPS